IIICAYNADPTGSYSGASYVVFGKASGFAANIDLSSLTGPDGFQLNGVAANDRTGVSVASAGDINGDGLSDLIVGAPYADSHGSHAGASYVVFGKLSQFAVDLTGTAASQKLVGSNLGDSLSGLDGNDSLFGHGGNDSLNGGAGLDTAIFSGSSTAYTITP